MAGDAPQLSETRQCGVGEEGDDNDIRRLTTTTLPMREGWPYPLFRFHGCWLTDWLATSIQLVQAEFKPRADDILLATFPKCGTTWLKALAFAVTNRSRHPVTGDDDHPLLHANPHDLVPFLEMPNRSLYPVAELEALQSPRLMSTHAPPALLPAGTLTGGGGLSSSRAVYLCREPKDVLVSLWHHVETVRRPEQLTMRIDEAFALFCEGVSVCGPIWEHYLQYWKLSVAENPSRVLFLRYEEMMARPAEHVRRLAEFLGAPFTEEEESGGVVEDTVRLCSFGNLKDLPVNMHGAPDRNGAGPNHDRLIKNSMWFRSGKVGDWENHLTQEMAHRLDCIVEEKLKGSGLSF